jgi:hypothetical protein
MKRMIERRQATNRVASQANRREQTGCWYVASPRVTMPPSVRLSARTPRELPSLLTVGVALSRLGATTNRLQERRHRSKLQRTVENKA